MHPLSEKLAAGLKELNVHLDLEQQEKLIKYLNLLTKWNKVHNLTAIREPEQMVTQHLLDSLSVLRSLPDVQALLDVGSGGGLPGIPLAIARPELKVTLIDSSHKKTAFLRQAKAELNLINLDVICDRVETWAPKEKFPAVISRAFADIDEFARLATHLIDKDGILLAMKGVYPFDEIDNLTKDFSLQEVVVLNVPFMDASRHLVILKKSV